MAVEVFANNSATNVSSGGTDAPAGGTIETWTVLSSSSFPAASSTATPPTQFHVTDPEAYSEVILVTNVSGNTWTVTRGAESTTPVAHLADFQVYQVSTAGALTQLRSTDWLNVVTMFGADPTGTNDSTAAIQAAVTAVPSSGGVVYLPAGTYKVSTTITCTASGVYLIGDGPWVTTIKFTGTGDCLRWYDASTYTTRTINGGGPVGITVNISSSGSGSCALHAGDILQFRFNITVEGSGSSSSTGIHLDNQNYWTEQANGVAYIDSCTQDVIFDCGGASTSNGSFDRGDFTFYLSHKTFTGNCITWQNGAYQFGGWVRVYGNINSSSSTFTKAVLAITGSAPGGHTASYSGLQCGLDINVESDEAQTYTFQTINFGSTNNTITDSFGNVNFGSGNQFTTSNITSVSGQFTFEGPVIGDNTLNEMTLTGRLAVPSEAFFFSSVYLGELGSAPSTPSGGGLLYVDGSGNLWYISPGAVSTELSAAVTSITAGDTSITVGGTAAAPTIETGSLDKIAGDHVTAGSWSNNNHGITSLALVGLSGSTGATAASRYVGAIASGSAPASGTFNTGDFIIIQTGGIAICTAGGTPGTWTAIT